MVKICRVVFRCLWWCHGWRQFCVTMRFVLKMIPSLPREYLTTCRDRLHIWQTTKSQFWSVLSCYISANDLRYLGETWYNKSFKCKRYVSVVRLFNRLRVQKCLWHIIKVNLSVPLYCSQIQEYNFLWNVDGRDELCLTIQRSEVNEQSEIDVEGRKDMI